MSQLRIKQGGALIVTLIVTDATGLPLNLAAVTLASTLRTATGALVDQLAITPNDIPGQATMLATDTAGWPVGILSGDLSVTQSGVTVLTQTFLVFVEKAMTP